MGLTMETYAPLFPSCTLYKVIPSTSPGEAALTIHEYPNTLNPIHARTSP